MLTCSKCGSEWCQPLCPQCSRVKVGEMNMKHCCEAWRTATTRDTLTVGSGPVVWHGNGRWWIGSDLPPVERCPWCGEVK